MSTSKAKGDRVESPEGDSRRAFKRFSAQRKSEAVMRLLRGEDLETLSRELGVAAHVLSSWRDRSLSAIRGALKERPRDGSEEDVQRLKAKVGDLTMENELLYERVGALEAGHPFAGRRSRR